MLPLLPVALSAALTLGAALPPVAPGDASPIGHAALSDRTAAPAPPALTWTVSAADDDDTAAADERIIILHTDADADAPPAAREEHIVIIGAPPAAPAPPAPPAPPHGVRQQHIYRFRTNDEGSPAKVWIGVRVTDVPDPLAAHIGPKGVMISNVFTNSPADKAGIEQYDVIVRFADRPVDSPQDLTAVIRELPANAPEPVELKRRGRTIELQLAPEERPQDFTAYTLKYDEPQDEFLRDAIKMRGRALMLGPGGEWQMQDLGELHGNLDALKDKLNNLDITIDLDTEGLDDAYELFVSPDVRDLREEQEVSIEQTITVTHDGETIVVNSQPDGRIAVQRKTADGETKLTMYGDAEDLAANDEQAYKIYRRHSGGEYSWIFGGSDKGTAWRFFPTQKRAEKLRKQYQIDVEKNLKRALREADEARAQAETQRQRVQRQQETIERRAAENARERARTKVRATANGEDAVLVKLADDGSIVVTITGDQRSVRYEFKSIAAMRESEPDLYERVRPLLEE
jgi:hypothetical protein